MGSPQKVVTTTGIAKIAGVKPKTVYQWRFREKLPPEHAFIKNRPVWLLDDIMQWLEDTNRTANPSIHLVE